ncbi:NADH:flavin oxidoreductase [Hoyosella altamirensis]|uniref:2,4-dienoyl-CoA reductase-like NADH-dependent reductase (Old Yellow Enzyme family) n=1 Tax=Hoyosella altamirensis TaxID=616997 RepID=A0A839RR00_9ACTN|nr:NADH:flavin oxidoreductase [Hoyosella altamirensis]MBB3039245.1 2,4-dienoyl-CoA reductase-like NADH-dependent reductase (Old Yellow Enzyme family) [Hoyosella altamirensis]
MNDVFAPAQLGPVRLRNRVIKAATFEGRTPDALVTDDLIDFHRAVAAGGVGMTTLAYCAVAPEGRTQREQLWMRPEALPGLRLLTEAVHAEGAAISAQIGHAGPVANEKSTRLRALAPSQMFSPLSMRPVRSAGIGDIRGIIAAHAQAARIAVEAGFDAVELHFGHNYFVSSFLSRRLNRRRDEYGGSLANRARLSREIAEAVRVAVGDSIAVLAKLSMNDGVPGGFWLDEAIQVAKWLDVDGHLDALELTAGSSLLNPMYLFKGDAPIAEFAAAMPQPVRFGIRLGGRAFLKTYPYHDLYLLEQARQIRSAVTMPLVLLGGITDRASMDTAMAEGFEFVAMARALLREPDLINRLKDEPTTPSLCIHCNKCMPTIFTRTRCVLEGSTT